VLCLCCVYGAQLPRFIRSPVCILTSSLMSTDSCIPFSSRFEQPLRQLWSSCLAPFSGKRQARNSLVPGLFGDMESAAPILCPLLHRFADLVGVLGNSASDQRLCFSALCGKYKRWALAQVNDCTSGVTVFSVDRHPGRPQAVREHGLYETVFVYYVGGALVRRPIFLRGNYSSRMD
jgi:hypothetical protein